MKANFMFLVLACAFGTGFLSGCEQRSGVDDAADATVAADNGGNRNVGDNGDTGGDTGDSGDTGNTGNSGGDTGAACASHEDCADSIECTIDLCTGGQCVKSPLNALCKDDGNPCVSTFCDPWLGCQMDEHALDLYPCADGNACTDTSFCEGGKCVADAERDCDDGNPCTNDTCNPGSGCVFTPNSAPCNDGSEYTTGDMCVGGVCTGAGISCLNPSDCDDDNPCTVMACIGGTCQKTGTTCDDFLACTVDTCDPAGGCTHTPKDALCGEGEWCEPGFMDLGGTGCTECLWDGMCDDGNVCTTFKCLDGQCVYTPVDEKLACDDGDACTQQSFCINGTCAGGDPKNCDDGNPCTKDYCHPEYGCGHEQFDCPGSQPSPPTSETCNGMDDDGDGYTDEPGAQGCTNYWYDGDGDGFGKPGQATCMCTKPNGYVTKTGDCNDNDPSKTTDCSAGGGNTTPPADSGKFCEVRVSHPNYQLNGWATSLPADECLTTDGGQWCNDISHFRVYGSGGLIIANAEAKSGTPNNVTGTVWAVGYTGESCKNNQLVTLSGVFQLSGDCDCKAACVDGTVITEQFGKPNLYCKVAL